LQRLARKQPERCTGEDEGLFATLFDEFSRRAEELPLLFDPRNPEVALRPSVAAVIGLGEQPLALFQKRPVLQGAIHAIVDERQIADRGF
jgi:hypothetical protein